MDDEIKKCPVQRKNGNVNAKKESDTHHWVKMANGKPMWVPKGTNPGAQPHRVHVYNEVTCNHVCDMLVEGKTMMDIGRMKGIPHVRILYRWMAQHPEFRDMVKEAKKLRAEYYHDKVISTAEKTTSSKAKGDSLRLNAFKWAAETGNPEEYGSKRREERKDPVVAVYIDTGIKRDVTVESIEVDSKVIEDKNGSK